MKGYINAKANTLSALEDSNKNWGTLVGIDDVIWQAWVMYDQKAVLPSGGGSLDQDPAVVKTFNRLSLIKEYWELPESSAPTMPNNW